MIDEKTITSRPRSSLLDSLNTVPDFALSAIDLASYGYGSDESDAALSHLYPAGVVASATSRE